MVKTIYKVTNLINGKAYVGQTNNFHRRYNEHKRHIANGDKLLYLAIEKYGWENFLMEIIEENVENYNEREQYWIRELNTLTPNGYNIDLIASHTNSHIVLKDFQIKEIKDKLKNTDLSYKEIAKQYNLKSEQTIRDINRGILYREKTISYPIRPQRNAFARERAIKVIDDLKNTNMNFNQLAEKYNCSSVCISNINTGRITIEGEEYPIRKNTRKGQKFSKETIISIYNDILNSNMTWKELSEKYNCNMKVFQHINQGKTNRLEGYTFPLRAKPTKKKGNPHLEEIIDLLLNSDMTFEDIGRKFNISGKTVSDINYGRTNIKDDIVYPIR